MNRPLRLAINGYGRIGRCVLRALYESPLSEQMQVVLINEPADLKTMTYLTRYDSTHGSFHGTVQEARDGLMINGTTLAVTHETDPARVPWADHNVDMVLECSGAFSDRDSLMQFLHAGCPRILVSQPGRSASDVDFTLVVGVNESGLTAQQRIVSNASCTTNATVPILAELHRTYGLEHVFLTTLHSVMNDQPMIDGYHHTDLRRTRSAMQSIVPVSTGLAQGVERLLPQLKGKVQAKAIRVPILNVSAIDVMLKLGRDVSVLELNQMLERFALAQSGLVDYSDHPHASIDFNHSPYSAIIDASQTRTNGDGFANVYLWFDNEWGFANRMLDAVVSWGKVFR
ncbi:MAG: type I glyceraldehyde-3-phosphate dehydrogenase [Burkholderiaceae bacterium]|jgi:D-erythrose 4-phosphate dehydrogenase